MDILNHTMLPLLVLFVGLTSESAAVSANSCEQIGIVVVPSPKPHRIAVQAGEPDIEVSSSITARLLEADKLLLAAANTKPPHQIRVIQIDARNFILDLIEVDQATPAR